MSAIKSLSCSCIGISQLRPWLTRIPGASQHLARASRHRAGALRALPEGGEGKTLSCGKVLMMQAVYNGLWNLPHAEITDAMKADLARFERQRPATPPQVRYLLFQLMNFAAGL